MEPRMRSENKQWPLVVRLSLSLLGYVVHSPRRKCVDHSTPSHVSYATTDHNVDPEVSHETDELVVQQNTNLDVEETVGSYGAVSVKNCRVCQHLNDQSYFRDDQLPARRQIVAASVWLIVLTALFCATLLRVMFKYFGENSYTLFTLSFLSQYGTLAVIVLVRLVAHFISFRPTATRAVYALSSENVFGLLARMDLTKHKRKGYFFLLFALVDIAICVAYETYPVFMKCMRHTADLDPWSIIAFISEVVGSTVFCSVCYIMFLLRKAIETDLRNLIPFFKKNERNIAATRKRLYESYLEFTRLNQLGSIWIVFQMSLVTFKFSCHIYWNYAFFTSKSYVVRASLINYLFWLQVFMYFALPLFALGGLNIQYVWWKFMAAVASEQTQVRAGRSTKW
ncbi:uncharacterized protein [Ptychodera flava]|uniref:uncharacterized protein n=1 Tax=Ptychodera flava TaxID=63121 RepID=UPI003969D2EA